MTNIRRHHPCIIRFARFAVFAALSFLLVPLSADAQQAGRTPRVGYLTERSGTTEFEESLLKGLRDLGYVDGKNLIIEYRWAAGNAERLPAMATDLVGLKVDIIVTSGVPAAKAAKNATSTIPIVMATSGDAVADGLVASFTRPGGNVTGLSLFTRQLSGKRLEVLKEAVPDLRRAGAVFNAANPSTPPQFRETEAAGDTLGLKVLPLDVHFPEGIDAAFAEAARQKLQGVAIISDSATIAHRTQLGTAALKYRLPTIFSNKAYLQGGGLMSYGPDVVATFYRAAYYVDKILKGAKPADLPVEQPTKFELVINMKTAKALGITIPQSLLLRADEVIE
jgi:putative tryptophan/tyrosine transport system substrate-binding protein